jgi:hypothetical protein
MSVRFLSACACLVLAAGSVPARASTPPPSYPRVYSVPDLVFPFEEGPPPGSLPDKPGEARCNPAGSTKTCEGELIQLITSTVCPRSWLALGGDGTITYFPLGNALVVNQTPEVQAQVADLLANLRRLQDVNVEVELRFVAVPPATLNRLRLERAGVGKEVPRVTFLDTNQLRRFLEAVQADPKARVMQAPRLTMRNGRRAVFEVPGAASGLPATPPYLLAGHTVPPAVQVAVLPLVSADNRRVTLNVQARLGEALFAPGIPAGNPANALTVKKTITVPNGATVLLDTGTRQVPSCASRQTKTQPPDLLSQPGFGLAFYRPENAPELEHGLILATPHILKTQEKEQKAPAALPPHSPRTAQAKPAPSEAPAAVKAPQGKVLFVSKKRFRLHYSLENTCAEDVDHVEVWWTRDGKAWRRHELTVPPTGLAPITVQREGRYGFTLRPVSVGGLAEDEPHGCTAPQVWVEVDQTPPEVKLQGVMVRHNPAGDGELRVRWTASDKWLKALPITVSFGRSPNGPWTVLAGDLENSGAFSCSTHGLPPEFFIRVEARDEAGNVGVAASKEPIKLELKLPRVRILGVVAQE